MECAHSGGYELPVSEYIYMHRTEDEFSVDNKRGELKSVVFKFVLIKEPLH